MQVHRQNLQVKVVLQGHRVMIKVTAASVSVCPVRSLNFDCLHLERSFVWYAGTAAEFLYQVRISRSLGQVQGHMSKRACLCRLSCSCVVRLRLKGIVVRSINLYKLFNVQFSSVGFLLVAPRKWGNL